MLTEIFGGEWLYASNLLLNHSEKCYVCVLFVCVCVNTCQLKKDGLESS